MRRFFNFSRVQWICLAIVAISAAVIMFGDVYTRQYLKSHYLRFERAEAAEVTTPIEVFTPNKIEEMKSDVLDRLSRCESGGKDIAVVFDSNGKASLGNYQWQIASFQHYWLKMTGEKLTEKQAAVGALDDEKARELAKWVIFETDKGVDSDWFNCAKWHDLQTLVDFIKAHE